MRMHNWAGIGLILAGGLASGCASLPRAAPNVKEVLEGASGQFGAPLSVVDLALQDRERIAEVSRSGPAPDCVLPESRWAAGRIEAGDVLRISAFEIGVALFSPGDAGGAGTNGDNGGGGSGDAPGAARAELRLPVDADGTIATPYLGRMKVAGMNAEEARAALTARLRTRSQSPDVLVTIEPGPLNGVIMSGEIRAPGRAPLTLAGERLLDVIALSGGLVGDPSDYSARVTRGDGHCVLGLGDLTAGAGGNLRLAGGDRVEILRQKRNFTALGAARAVATLPIEGRSMSLIEAIGRAGGPLDSEADPRGVFLFRFEPGADGGEIPTIYRLNLLDPRAYFIGQRFAIREGDVVFIASAGSNQLFKFIQLLNLLVTPAVSARVLAR